MRGVAEIERGGAKDGKVARDDPKCAEFRDEGFAVAYTWMKEHYPCV